MSIMNIGKTKLFLIVFAVMFLAPVSVRAATTNITGWETGGITELAASAGTTSVQTTTKRTGSYALQVNPTTTGTGYHDVREPVANGTNSANLGATWYSSFYFNYATKAAANDEIMFLSFDVNGATKMEVRLNSSGNLAAYDSAGTLVATGTTVLSSGTWYRVCVESRNGAAAAYSVTIDGVSELSGTMDQLATNIRASRLGKALNRNGNTVDYFYDDYIANDAECSPAGEVKAMTPNATGNYQAWTIGAGAGSNYENVDEIPHDTDTTYLVSTLSIGDAETEGMVSGATAGITGTVNMVKAHVVMKRDGAANGTANVRFRSNTTDSDTTTSAITNAYEGRSKVFVTDPATSAAWVLSALDSIEVGVIEGETTDKTRVTQSLAMVHYTPAAGVVKTWDDLAWGSVKTWGDLAAGSVKTVDDAASQ